MKLFAVAWIIPVVAVSYPAAAQQAITLQQAIQTALQKNEHIQSAEYQVEFAKQYKKTSTDVGKLSAIWMHGQYNSLYQDDNVTLVQTLPFPTQLGSQVRLGKEQVIGAQKSLRVSQNDIVFEVKTAYYQLLYLEALNRLLQSQDSLYGDFSRGSSIRYRTGESTLLEKATAETQWMEVKNQYRINQADIQIAQSRLQVLLKSEFPVTAADALARRPVPNAIDSSALSGNPQLDYFRQQTVIGQRIKSVEYNRILPDIHVGYFNQSLTGIQNINGQDQYFGHNKRFQGIELGLSIPLWVRPYLARAKSAGIQEEIARKNASYYQTSLEGAHHQAIQELDKNLASLDYFEGSALKNSDFLLLQAGKSYHNGEIGYIEYLQAVKNAITIKSGYLQSLNLYNQSVIRIEFLYGLN